MMAFEDISGNSFSATEVTVGGATKAAEHNELVDTAEFLRNVEFVSVGGDTTPSGTFQAITASGESGFEIAVWAGLKLDDATYNDFVVLSPSSLTGAVSIATLQNRVVTVTGWIQQLTGEFSTTQCYPGGSGERWLKEVGSYAINYEDFIAASGWTSNAFGFSDDTAYSTITLDYTADDGLTLTYNSDDRGTGAHCVVFMYIKFSPRYAAD